jgi:hypothetical protein
VRLLLNEVNVGGNVDKEEMPMAVLPDKSALDRSDDNREPVLGSISVKQPPPPPGVSVDDGFIVVTLRMYFGGAIVDHAQLEGWRKQVVRSKSNP